MNLVDLVASVENMTDNCQRALLDALKEIIYRQKGSAKLKPCSELEAILEIGILQLDEGRYSVAEAAKKKARKLYTYLLRKFDVELYFDEDGTLKEIPKGSEFVATINMDGSSRLVLQFPDDEVTTMLNLFGTNRCENWQ